MARVSTTAKPNNAAYDVSATAYNALVGDYVSQTDAVAQSIASAINFTNATVTKSGTALATTTNVSDHAALTTGVHGVGAGTIAKTTDITWANLTGAPFVTVGPSGCTYTTDGTADEVQINQAIAAVGKKGTVQLMPNTTYTLADDIDLVGLGTDAAMPASKVTIRGCGYSTILSQGAASKNIFTLSNAAIVELTDMKLVEPTANSGHAIESLDTGADSAYGFTDSYFNNLYIYGCDATHNPMKLVNPFFSDFGYIKTNSTTANTGICFEACADGAVTHFGNCHIKHFMLYNSHADSYVLNLKATEANAYLNLMRFDSVEATTGGNGILIESSNSSPVCNNRIAGLDLECTGKQIKFTCAVWGIFNNTFSGYMIPADGQIAIDNGTNNWATGANLFDFDVYLPFNGAGDVLVADNNAGTTVPQNTYNFRIQPGSVPLTTNSFALNSSAPKITWQSVTADPLWLKNPNRGAAATVNDGGTIPHRVGLTPTWATAVGSVANEFVAITAIDATNITVAIKKRADGGAGTAQTIYWAAGYNSE